MNNRRSFLKSLIAAVVLSPAISRLSNTFKFDWDAKRYCRLAQIIDANVESAVHNLVSELKTSGLWEKLGYLYPLVGNGRPLMGPGDSIQK